MLDKKIKDVFELIRKDEQAFYAAFKGLDLYSRIALIKEVENTVFSEKPEATERRMTILKKLDNDLLKKELREGARKHFGIFAEKSDKDEGTLSEKSKKEEPIKLGWKKTD